MRKTPSAKTIKKLFALSGNICAFPDCNESLVDSDGCLIGQICHIEAAEKGGERFNSNQTDNQRAAFENLILFCPKHHIITNDVKKYPVKKLQKIKTEHEKKFIKNKYQINDEIVDQAKKSFQTQNIINNGGHQENYQSNTMVIYQGITVTEVTNLVKELFEANFPKLAVMAQTEAKKNIIAFQKQFEDDIAEKLEAKDLLRFSNPDIQASLNNAVQSAARKDSQPLRSILSELVIQRVKKDEDELQQKVLNEAILTVPKLTLDQLKIITLCFILKRVVYKKCFTWDVFKSLVLEQQIKPFLGFKGTSAEILHLQYTGCGQINEVFSVDLSNVFRQHYAFAFQKPSTQEEINALGLPLPLQQNFLAQNNQDKFIFASNEGELEEKLKQFGVEDELKKRITSLYKSKIMNDNEIKLKIENELPWCSELYDRFQNTDLNGLTLTSVGLAIAISYYEKVLKQPLNIDIWIN